MPTISSATAPVMPRSAMPAKSRSRQARHPRPGALGAHGLAQLVGLGRGEPRGVDGDLHELLLEQRHPERLGERPLEQGVRGVGCFEALAPADVGVHRPSLDGTGPDDGHLDHQVGEAPRPDAGERGHLGPALHLEHPHGVGPAQHVVDGVLLGQHGQVDLHAVGDVDQVDGAVQGLEHPQPEQVELDETGRGAVVLVPLQGAAPRMPGPFHRAHLDDGPVAEHHPPRVQAEMAGEVEDLPGELRHERWQGAAAVERLTAVDGLGPRVDLLGAVPEGLADVADGRAGAVGDDVGYLGRAVAAVALVDVGDDLLAPARLDVDVDVGWPVALGGEEPLEQQPAGPRRRPG